MESASKGIGKLHHFEFNVMRRRWLLRPAISYVSEVSGTVKQIHKGRLNQHCDRTRTLSDQGDVSDELQRIAKTVLAPNEHLTVVNRRAIPSQMVWFSFEGTHCLTCAPIELDTICLPPGLFEIPAVHCLVPEHAHVF
ncbi:MAG: hypothetical protein ACXWCY_33035 [Burkholderiales bacterium]